MTDAVVRWRGSKKLAASRAGVTLPMSKWSLDVESATIKG